MPQAIDVNRGVMVKRDTASGMYIYMYIDTPGVYYNGLGREVPEALAASVGYDTATFAREKRKRQMMTEAMGAIEAELELAQSAKTEDILREQGGYKVIGVGTNMAHIAEAETGERITTTPVPVELAMATMDKLVGPAQAKPKAVETAPKTTTSKEQGASSKPKEAGNGSS